MTKEARKYASLFIDQNVFATSALDKIYICRRFRLFPDDLRRFSILSEDCSTVMYPNFISFLKFSKIRKDFLEILADVSTISQQILFHAFITIAPKTITNDVFT